MQVFLRQVEVAGAASGPCGQEAHRPAIRRELQANGQVLASLREFATLGGLLSGAEVAFGPQAPAAQPCDPAEQNDKH
jgi:hypothetical protein